MRRNGNDKDSDGEKNSEKQIAKKSRKIGQAENLTKKKSPPMPQAGFVETV
jgi:hypothetical protein